MGYSALEMTTPLLRVQQWAEAGPLRRLLARGGVRLAGGCGGQTWQRIVHRLPVAPARTPQRQPGAAPGLAGPGYAFRIPGLHAPLPLGEQYRPALCNAQTLGAAYVVVSLPAAEFATPEAVWCVCTQLNTAAQEIAPHGLRLAYHNHWWEFESLQGRLPFEMMLEWLDPAIAFEVDVYWVQAAGHDPAALVRRLAQRAPLLHLKDGPATRNAAMTALGQGVVDLPAVLAASSPDSWWIVELDRCATDMLTAVQASYTFLQAYSLKMG